MPTEQQKMIAILEGLKSDVLHGHVDFLCVLSQGGDEDDPLIRVAGTTDPKDIISALIKGAYRTLRS